jgi:hypothetical protein
MTASIAARGMRSAESGPSAAVGASALAVAATMAISAEGCSENNVSDTCCHLVLVPAILLSCIILSGATLYYAHQAPDPDVKIIQNIDRHIARWPKLSPKKRLHLVSRMLNMRFLYKRDVMCALQRISDLPGTDHEAIIGLMLDRDFPKFHPSLFRYLTVEAQERVLLRLDTDRGIQVWNLWFLFREMTRSDRVRLLQHMENHSSADIEQRMRIVKEMKPAVYAVK